MTMSATPLSLRIARSQCGDDTEEAYIDCGILTSHTDNRG